MGVIIGHKIVCIMNAGFELRLVQPLRFIPLSNVRKEPYSTGRLTNHPCALHFCKLSLSSILQVSSCRAFSGLKRTIQRSCHKQRKGHCIFAEAPAFQRIQLVLTLYPPKTRGKVYDRNNAKHSAAFCCLAHSRYNSNRQLTYNTSLQATPQRRSKPNAWSTYKPRSVLR